MGPQATLMGPQQTLTRVQRGPHPTQMGAQLHEAEDPTCVQRGPHAIQTGAQLHEADPQPTLSRPAKLHKS
jgi:hypothetical protein